MRTKITSLLLCVALTHAAGCSDRPYHDPVNISGVDGAESEQGNSASKTSGLLQNQETKARHFPSNESIGTWMDDDETRRLIKLEDVAFQTRRPNPDQGYVPIEAMGHTLAARLHNCTDKHLANIELQVTANSRETGDTLAVLSTDSVIPYFLVPPQTAVDRTIELTFGDNGEDHSPFANAENWPPFSVSIDVIRAKFLEDDSRRGSQESTH